MKNNPIGESFMSVEHCTTKLRFFTLVVNTADLINVHTNPTLGISHASVAPVSICTIYVFYVSFVIGGIKGKYASVLLQIYALVTCSALEIFLSILVFRELMQDERVDRNSGLVLNGILPTIITLLLLSDLVVTLFSSRPVSPAHTLLPIVEVTQPGEDNTVQIARHLC